LTKTEQKKIIKKQKLLDAALDMFLENGLESTTIAQIAHRAGLAKGTFYLYFKDKNDAAQQLVQHYADRMLNDAWSKCYPPGDGWDGAALMKRIAGEIIDALARDTRLIGFIHNNLSFALFAGITASPAGGDPVNMLDAIIALCEESGVRMRHPRVAIFMVVELIAGSCYQSVTFKNPLPIEQLKPYLFTAIEGIVDRM
jgi:AcrR family transcriptional regulator